MDSRHDGKRFPGCPKENARPSPFLALVFFILMMMTRAHPTRLLLVTLTLGLFVLGLAVLPNLGALPAMETDNFGGFEQVETDDDLAAGAAFGASKTGDASFRVLAVCLDFQSLPITIVPPPPNQA